MAKQSNQTAYMNEPDTLDLFASLSESTEKTVNEELQSQTSDTTQDVVSELPDSETTKTQLQEQVEDVIAVDKPLRQPRVKKKEPKSSRRRGRNKEGGAFKTISELATYLDIPQHVLRFWETKFSQIKPMKRGGGRRYYRPEDVQIVERIHHLLYNEGYTIKGVQRLIRISSKQEFLEGASGVVVANSETKTTASKETTQTPKSEAKKDTSSNASQTEEAMRTILRGLKDIRRELAS